MAGRNGGMTMDQIAAELGISKTTVSRALSGKGRVSTETRARVLELAHGAGAAPRLRTHNLSLVIPEHFMRLDLPFLRKCMGGVTKMAAQRGYDLLLCYVSESDTEQLERQLANRKMDGVILSRTIDNDPCVTLLQRYGVPFVAIGRLNDIQAPQIDNDQLGASAEITRLLLQVGMRRIAFFSGNLNYTVNADRLHGYLRGFTEVGLSADHALIYTGIETDAQRTDALENLLEQSPECLLCCDDAMAFWALQALRQRGISVPEQLRLASLYDSELLFDATPPISAVQFDAERLGNTAARLLLDQIAGKPTPQRQVQGYQVILRESTK